MRGRPQTRQHRPVMRIIIGIRRNLSLYPWCPAGKHRMPRGAVRAIAMRQRSDDCVLIGMLGQSRQMFGNLDSGNIRGNRLEFAANLRRRCGLHVPNIDVAWAAEKIDENTRFGLAESGRLFRSASLNRSVLQKPTAKQPQRASQTDTQAITPRPPFSQVLGTATEQNHSS